MESIVALVEHEPKIKGHHKRFSFYQRASSRKEEKKNVDRERENTSVLCVREKHLTVKLPSLSLQKYSSATQMKGKKMFWTNMIQ